MVGVDEPARASLERSARQASRLVQAALGTRGRPQLQDGTRTAAVAARRGLRLCRLLSSCEKRRRRWGQEHAGTNRERWKCETVYECGMKTPALDRGGRCELGGTTKSHNTRCVVSS